MSSVGSLEREIREMHDRMVLATRVGGIGVWDFDMVGNQLVCDDQWYRIMGRDPGQPISSLEEFQLFIHPDDVERATEVELLRVELAAKKEDYGAKFRILRPDGDIRWIRSVACLIGDHDGLPSRAVGFVSDITDSVRSHERLKQSNAMLRQANIALCEQRRILRRMSFNDGLTGIANRRCFDRDLGRACRLAARNREPLVLALIDIDFFKQYNDLYGHPEGDRALQMVADVLASVARRPLDLAARYGGEEFALMLPNCDDLESVHAEIAQRIAALRIPHAGSSASPYVTVSLGGIVARLPGDMDPERLVKCCDTVLYQAKKAGRNRAVMWKETLREVFTLPLDYCSVAASSP